jgi:hypothetical protein
MFSLLTILVSFVFLTTINQINCLQCYTCRCSVNLGENTCTDEGELQCIIEHVENNYCYISRLLTELELGHRPNSDLTYLESLHYIRAKEAIFYLPSSSTWQAPFVVEVLYGCDWNLCNTPRILNLLPNGLTFAVDSNVLSNTLLPEANEPFETCLNCTKCVNSTSALSCQTPTCTGTCYIDDHLDDSTLNTGSCSFAFESRCLPQIFNTTIQITGTYYIDDKLFGINEIDMLCRRTNCNDPTHAQVIQRNTTYTAQINDQLYFRPELASTTPLTPNNGLLGCYKCDCEHEIGDGNCKVLACTIEYQNASYCEIVRDFKTYPGQEWINLGHVQRDYVPYKHFIHAEEELILYKNLSWHPPSVSLISYVCDWELCNDGRLVDKLTTSFQFNAEPSEIAQYIQSSEPLSYCLKCSICTNSSLDFEQCANETCPSTGRCFIDQYIDDPQFDDCEYAFQAECEAGATESSIIITATYNIDDDELDFDEVDLYCSKNGCNRPETIYSLLALVKDDIQLDSLFFFRPFENTTAPPIITEPTPSTTASIPGTTTLSTSTVTGTTTLSTSTTTGTASQINSKPASLITAIFFVFIFCL